MAEVEKSRQTHTRLSLPHPHFTIVTYPSYRVGSAGT